MEKIQKKHEKTWGKYRNLNTPLLDFLLSRQTLHTLRIHHPSVLLAPDYITLYIEHSHDNDYRNSIKFRFGYRFQPEDFMSSGEGVIGCVNENKIYRKGDKIGQLKFSKVINAQFRLVDKLQNTDRGQGGFGSTGK